MTYTLMNLLFLTAAAAVAVAAAVVSRQRRGLKVALVAGVVTLAVLVVFTAVFDNIMIAVGLVAYDDSHRSGWNIGIAPVEDFAYTLAAVLLLPSLWILLGGRKR